MEFVIAIAAVVWVICGFSAWHSTMRLYVPWSSATAYDLFMVLPCILIGPIALIAIAYECRS